MEGAQQTNDSKQTDAQPYFITHKAEGWKEPQWSTWVQPRRNLTKDLQYY